MKHKLRNTKPGYVEVWFWYGDVASDGIDQLGVVDRKQVVDYTDFENDRIFYVKRWFIFSYDSKSFSKLTRIGRETGYRTRKEALQALIDYWTVKE